MPGLIWTKPYVVFPKVYIVGSSLRLLYLKFNFFFVFLYSP